MELSSLDIARTIFIEPIGASSGPVVLQIAPILTQENRLGRHSHRGVYLTVRRTKSPNGSGVSKNSPTTILFAMTVNAAKNARFGAFEQLWGRNRARSEIPPLPNGWAKGQIPGFVKA